MAQDGFFGLENRIGLAAAERAASAAAFVEGRDGVGPAFNDAYLRTVELYGDEYAPFLFTKGMPLARDADGERYPEGVVPVERKRRQYLHPIGERSDLSADGEFERGGRRLFIGVPGVHTVPLSGIDSWLGTMPHAPDPTGPRTAAEMVDVYGMEQVRDVPFVRWPNEPGGDGGDGVAADVLDALSADLGAAAREVGDWWHDTDRLFVEPGTGSVEWWGPYLSQFLLQEVPFWSLPVEQRYLRYERGVDYNGTREDWLDTLEGRDANSAEVDPNTPSRENRGYLATPRHLATIVNAEPPYQEYLLATLRLLGKVEFDPGMAHVTRDGGNVFGYTESGPVGLFDMVSRVCRQALLAAFYQKYYVHFRCRPETYAGRLQAQRNRGRDFGIPGLLADSETLAVRDAPADYLTTAYEEGSPVHPAYPSGHSVIAGACGTVLKTWFRDADWPDDLGYYVPENEGGEFGTGLATTTLPSGHNGVYQEIDKLMSNVGLARMFAGVHYYSDHYWGVKLGEQVAVATMADVFARAFDGAAEIDPTFKPYLQYGTGDALGISVETLDRLRTNATRRAGSGPRQA
jgi:hypothetical protein